MAWDIHPFMEKPCNAHFVCDNRIQDKVMFDGETAAARVPILTWLAQLWVDGKLP